MGLHQREETLNELTAAALEYLALGHHLLALTGKRPNPRYHGKDADGNGGWSWDMSIHGVPETGEECAALEAVFEDPTTSGVAILIPEHVLVADVDTEDAAALFMELAGEMPETVTAKTTKGLHVWFWSPGADASRWLGGRSLLFKGFGGYVAAPPSAHLDEKGVQDGVYTWLRPFDTGIDGLPAGIEARMRFERALDATQPVKTGDTGRFMVVNWPKLYPSYHIEGLCRAIKEAPDGNQNNMIAWAAMQARDEGVPYETAMPLLLTAAIEGGHPKQRAIATIKGAFTRKRRG
jgi:hypothetical protein